MLRGQFRANRPCFTGFAAFSPVRRSRAGFQHAFVVPDHNGHLENETPGGPSKPVFRWPDEPFQGAVGDRGPRQSPAQSPAFNPQIRLKSPFLYGNQFIFIQFQKMRCLPWVILAHA